MLDWDFRRVGTVGQEELIIVWGVLLEILFSGIFKPILKHQRVTEIFNLIKRKQFILMLHFNRTQSKNNLCFLI